jgi:hypothetical protein
LKRPKEGDLLTLRPDFFFVNTFGKSRSDPFLDVSDIPGDSELSRTALVTRSISVGPYIFVKVILDGRSLYFGSEPPIEFRRFRRWFTWESKNRVSPNHKVELGSILCVDPHVSVDVNHRSGYLHFGWAGKRFFLRDSQIFTKVEVVGILSSGNLRVRFDGRDTWTLPVFSLQFVSLGSKE